MRAATCTVDICTECITKYRQHITAPNSTSFTCLSLQATEGMIVEVDKSRQMISHGIHNFLLKYLHSDFVLICSAYLFQGTLPSRKPLMQSSHFFKAKPRLHLFGLSSLRQSVFFNLVASHRSSKATFLKFSSLFAFKLS